MRKLSVLLGSTTLLFAGNTAYLFRELQAARSQVEVTRRRSGELREQLSQLMLGRGGSITSLSALRMSLNEVPVAPSAPTAASPATPKTDERPAAWNLSELPLEHRKTMLRAMYSELLRELHLSDEESDALLTVLAEQDARNPAAGLLAANAATALTPDERARNDGELAALLGDQKAARFAKLKKLLPARTQLRAVRSQLESLGEPLSPEQERDLLQLLNSKVDPPASRPAVQAPEDLRESLHERNRRFREQAEVVLTPMQLKRLEEQDALQKELESRLPLPALPASSSMPAAAGSAAPRKP